MNCLPEFGTTDTQRTVLFPYNSVLSAFRFCVAIRLWAYCQLPAAKVEEEKC